jgi:hypothetical protein
MQTMNDALLGLVKGNQVDPQEAYDQSISKKEMGLALSRAGYRGSWAEEGA